MEKRIILACLCIAVVHQAMSQSYDSLKVKTLDSVSVRASKINPDIQRLDPIQGTYLYAGKKSEVIELSQAQISLTEKYGRQIFSKIPGVFVYDMDGTGNQMNIATRGLDPHRGWEFNNRKDGVITNSDMYGYPASHYNIPMEAVGRIELVRGTASLQYGAQFGGMLNYVSKQPDSTRQLTFESINTIGSYGLVSTYNGASGKIGRFRYSTWINKKWITGYRSNGDSQFDAAAVTIYYDVSSRLNFKIEWTRSNYITHLPGPLTDQMFRDNPRMSTRSRNYYNPDIHVPSFTMDWKISDHTRLKVTTSAIIGARNSVMFDQPATVADTIGAATRQYSNRQVDIDHFNSYTTEARVLHTYSLFGKENNLVWGVQYMHNNLHRQQQGKGTTGTDFDLTLVVPGWGRDLNYQTQNVAVFAENQWRLHRKFTVNTGARLESGETRMSGTITYYPSNEVPNLIQHQFPLFGISAQYDLTPKINLYGGWSQSYRPVIFKDIIPGSVYEVSDKNLKDAYGYNAEIGFRGTWRFLRWDVSAFQLQYNNRMGTIAQTDGNGNLIIYKTNIGDSRTNGVEMFVQSDFSLGNKTSISLFTSTSYMDARYQNAVIRSGSENINVSGNHVESAPAWISRSGARLRHAAFTFSALFSYTTESYADALNTVVPSATGATGLVPSYQLVDFHAGIRLTDHLRFQCNINNVLDRQYFTKRPQFYPGPGIWSSDGRTWSATVAIRL